MAVIVALGFFLLNENKSVPKKKEEKQEETKQEETTKVEVPLLKDGDEVVIVENGKQAKGVVKLMPQGLQVWDEDGNLRLDITDRLTHILDKIDTKTHPKGVKEYQLGGGDALLWWSFYPDIVKEEKPGDDGVLYSFGYINIDFSYTVTETGKCTVNYSSPNKGTLLIGAS